MNPILIFSKNKVQAVLDSMVLHTQQDRAQIPFISEICPACGNRRYCSPRKARKNLFYAFSGSAASRVLKIAGWIDPSVGGNPIQFIPFEKAIKSQWEDNRVTCSEILSPHTRPKKAPWSVGTEFPQSWLSRTLFFALQT